jgi:luciferase family oxidoreductase group 1
MDLSVLDLAPISAGSSEPEALRRSVALARATEALGYRRFWVAEHHNMPSIASSAPEVLIAHIAAATRTIRVGSGGVMLPNHAPLAVAERFATLEALHPGRIDLGLGRAPGTDPRTAYALRRGGDPAGGPDLPELLAELEACFDGFPADHPFAGMQAVPGRGLKPPIWLLGSSTFSAQLAGLRGLPFAFAYHFSAEHAEPAMRLYRQRFTPSKQWPRPRSMLTVSVMCAETSARATELAQPMALAWVRIRSGRMGPIPTIDEATRHPWTAAERAVADAYTGTQVIGDPTQVRAGLRRLVDRHSPDELMILTITHGFADRVRSYELLADAFEQRVAPSASP